MYTFETQIRVRYGETDQMGYVYYGNYPLYYEVARTEMLRAIGLSYRKMEEEGIIMPVRSLQSNYISAAHYDDLLTVKVILNELPGVRIHFFYEICNEQSVLLNTGDTELIFVNAQTRRPQRAPEILMTELRKYFTTQCSD
jgi:acyl-CoA thioester hydrolase